jgi:hypothetical protein
LNIPSRKSLIDNPRCHCSLCWEDQSLMWKLRADQSGICMWALQGNLFHGVIPRSESLSKTDFSEKMIPENTP